MRRGLFVGLLIWCWSFNAFAGPSQYQTAAELYRTLTSEDSETHWWTEDAAGNPAMCVFLGYDPELHKGIALVSYVSYDDSSEIVRTDTLKWRIVDGDVLDIQGNYFVLSHMGQLYRIPRPDGVETVRQTLRPGSW